LGNEYKTRRSLQRLGHFSLAVTLPKVWADANGLKNGDQVELVYDAYDFLKVVPQKQKMVEKK